MQILGLVLLRHLVSDAGLVLTSNGVRFEERTRKRLLQSTWCPPADPRAVLVHEVCLAGLVYTANLHSVLFRADSRRQRTVVLAHHDQALAVTEPEPALLGTSEHAVCGGRFRLHRAVVLHAVHIFAAIIVVARSVVLCIFVVVMFAAFVIVICVLGAV